MNQANRPVVVDIEALTDKGDGIGYWQGKKIFVSGALPGESVQIRCYDEKPAYAQGELLAIDTPHPGRVTPRCHDAGECGGCQIAHLDYPAQLQWKQDHVQTLLSARGIEAPVSACLGMSEPYHFRNKGIYAVRQSVDGKPMIGFYQKGSHQVVDIQNCLVHPQQDGQWLALIRQWMSEYHVSAYDESNQQGCLRYVMIRHGIQSAESMIVLVTANREPLSGLELLQQQLVSAGVTCLLRNINVSTGNRILGDETESLFGPSVIHDELLGFKFAISAHSFYQVNAYQTSVLYQQVLQAAQLKGSERVFDLYCGIGSITLCLSQQAREVIGIELVDTAIDDARHNAARNQVDHVHFIAGKVEHEIDALFEKGQSADVVVLDPPRKGCELSVLETLARHRPPVLVYVSCDPASLARDLKYLTTQGYRIDHIQPVDMFPHTLHVETVVRLSID